MAGGFAKDGAVQDQIDATVEDAIREHLEGSPEVMTVDSACAHHGQHHQGRVQGFVDLKK